MAIENEPPSLGSLKLEYNNDAMKLKKYVVQAKTQVINNLSKKIKKIKSNKGSESLKEKFNKKSESILKEIQLLKKVKYRELVDFAMTNNIELSKIMNTPLVTQEKVIAKLISHKSLTLKLNEIKNKYKSIPFSELLEMNPKKARQKKIKDSKNKKIKKINTEKSSQIMEVDHCKYDISSCEDTSSQQQTDDLEYNKKSKKKRLSESSAHSTSDFFVENIESDETSGIQKSNTAKILKKDVPNKTSHETQNNTLSSSSKGENDEILIDLNCIESSIPMKKTIDSFFVTNSGDRYMTMAIPRPPDDLQKTDGNGDSFEIGNRKMRRATIFGNKKNLKNKKTEKHKINFSKDIGTVSSNKINARFSKDDSTKSIMGSLDDDRRSSQPTEKLHPSWEAKKQQSSIANFQGKKIVFGD